MPVLFHGTPVRVVVVLGVRFPVEDVVGGVVLVLVEGALAAQDLAHDVEPRLVEDAVALDDLRPGDPQGLQALARQRCQHLRLVHRFRLPAFHGASSALRSS